MQYIFGEYFCGYGINLEWKCFNEWSFQDHAVHMKIVFENAIRLQEKRDSNRKYFPNKIFYCFRPRKMCIIRRILYLFLRVRKNNSEYSLIQNKTSILLNSLIKRKIILCISFTFIHDFLIISSVVNETAILSSHIYK